MKRGRKPKTKETQPSGTGSEDHQLSEADYIQQQPVPQQKIIQPSPQQQKAQEIQSYAKPKEFQHLNSLPKCTVIKFFSEQLATSGDFDVRLAATSQDLLVQLTTAFLDHVADEANNVCQEAGRACIIPEHVIEAMTRMQLGECLKTMSSDVSNENQNELDQMSQLKANKNANSAELEALLMRNAILKKMNNCFSQQRPSRIKPMQIEGEDSDLNMPTMTHEQLASHQQDFLKKANSMFSPEVTPFNSSTQQQNKTGPSPEAVNSGNLYAQQSFVSNGTNIQGPALSVNDLPPAMMEESIPGYFGQLIQQTDFCGLDEEDDNMDAQEDVGAFWDKFASRGSKIELAPIDEEMASDLEIMGFANLTLEQHSNADVPDREPIQHAVQAAATKRVGPPTNNKSNKKKHAKI